MINQDLLFNTNQGCFTYRVGALIINDNKLLMAKNKEYPCYYTVGGGVRINETSEEAVIREVLEETGFTLEIDRLAYVQERFIKISGQQYHEIRFFYLMKKSNINIIDNSFTDQGEKETLHWLPIDELAKLNVVPPFLQTRLANPIDVIEHIVSSEY